MEMEMPEVGHNHLAQVLSLRRRFRNPETEDLLEKGMGALFTSMARCSIPVEKWWILLWRHCILSTAGDGSSNSNLMNVIEFEQSMRMC
jgi:hypothetical protein